MGGDVISDTARGESAWETKCEGGVLGGRGTGDVAGTRTAPSSSDIIRNTGRDQRDK